MQRSEKNILIVAYLFPPIGGSGALRPLKIAQYLPSFGYHPVILTVKNPDWYYATDGNLLEELNGNIKVVRSKMFKSAWIYWALNPFRNKRLDSIIHDYIFHPDEQIGWILPAFKKVFQVIKNQRIDAVYSTSGPLSSHLIGLLLKNKFKLPWIAEFRDEWIEAPYLKIPTHLHYRFHWMLERAIVTRCDHIVTMAPQFGRFLLKHGISSKKITTIPAGYDPEEFPLTEPHVEKERQAFTLTFTGVFYPSFPPTPLLRAVYELFREGTIHHTDVRIQFVGPNTKENIGFDDTYRICEFKGYVPRKTALAYLRKSDCLLLLLSKKRGSGVIPSKVFEYLASEKPILAVIPEDGEVAKLLIRSKMAEISDYDNIQKIKKTFMALFHRWKAANLPPKHPWPDRNIYSISKMTGNLAGRLDEIVQTPNN